MFAAKIMQMSGMQACLYIPECRLSYAKIRISGDKTCRRRHKHAEKRAAACRTAVCALLNARYREI